MAKSGPEDAKFVIRAQATPIDSFSSYLKFRFSL